MGKLSWAVLLFASASWAQDAQVQAAPEPPRDAITVRTGLGPWVSPEAGVAWSHRLGERLAFTLGFYGARTVSTSPGAASDTAPSSSVFTLEPGARVFLNRAGVFIGATLVGGYALMTVQGAYLRRLGAGADLIAGIAHVFDGCFAVEVYAGAAGRTFFDTDNLSGTAMPTHTLVAALRAGIGVGWAF